jgi:hypothetical protein
MCPCTPLCQPLQITFPPPALPTPPSPSTFPPPPPVPLIVAQELETVLLVLVLLMLEREELVEEPVGLHRSFSHNSTSLISVFQCQSLSLSSSITWAASACMDLDDHLLSLNNWRNSSTINSASDNAKVLPWLNGKFEIPTNIVALADLCHLNRIIPVPTTNLCLCPDFSINVDRTHHQGGWEGMY